MQTLGKNTFSILKERWLISRTGSCRWHASRFRRACSPVIESVWGPHVVSSEALSPRPRQQLLGWSRPSLRLSRLYLPASPKLCKLRPEVLREGCVGVAAWGAPTQGTYLWPRFWSQASDLTLPMTFPIDFSVPGIVGKIPLETLRVAGPGISICAERRGCVTWVHSLRAHREGAYILSTSAGLGCQDVDTSPGPTGVDGSPRSWSPALQRKPLEWRTIYLIGKLPIFYMKPRKKKQRRRKRQLLKANTFP